MPDNKIKREMTFSEELPYFKERIKEIFDNSDNPDGYADMLYLSTLSDSNRIVRKAEEEIKCQQEEINILKADLKRVCAERDARICTNNFIKSEAVKEFANILKNKIKTECNPYGAPTFDYDTSIKILNFIDNLVKEMVGDE